MGVIKEFKEFAVKGNVVDLAVGVVIGAAFGGVVKSLVDDIITPPLGLITNTLKSLQDVKIPLRQAEGDVQEVAIFIGKFLNNVVNFLIVAFVIFLVVKQINRLKRTEAVAPSDPTTKVCSYCQTTIPIKASRCPNCTSELAG